LLSSLLLHGDGFIRIVRGKVGLDRYAVVGFEWLHANQVSVIRENGRLIYRVTLNDNTQAVLDAADMLHVPGAGFNGLRGLSQLKYALFNAGGIALAADQYSAAFFENGARPDFAIELSGKPSPDAQEMDRAGGPVVFALGVQPAGSPGRTRAFGPRAAGPGAHAH
jgi:phage portal protein BeeE